MLKLLQESAIKNFGNNPVRVLGESDPSTPGHELIDKVIDKIPASQIGELLKALLGRK
jgi:hypothetical protein